MKKTITSVALLSLVGFIPTLQAQTTASTDPVGGVTVTIQGDSKLNFVAVPLVTPISSQVTSTGMTGTTITATGAGWTTNQFANTHFVEIASGNATGLMVDITSNTTDTLTLANDISSYTPGTTAAIKIRAHLTIGSVFGATNSAGLQGGSTAGSSDEVMVWNPVTQTFTSYFYNTIQSQWKSAADPFGVDKTSTLIYPDQGIVINRKGTGSVNVILTGNVKTGVTKGQVYTGYNFYNPIKPVDNLTLAATGWQSDLTTGSTAGSSDEIGIWDPAAQTITNYFYNSIQSQWKLATDPFGADAGTTVIPLGASILINRKGSAAVVNETALTIAQ